MKRELGLIFGLFLGVGGTIGGWWILLTIFGLAPPLSYSILNLIVGVCTFATVITALTVGGPYIIYDVIRSYREEAEEQ